MAETFRQARERAVRVAQDALPSLSPDTVRLLVDAILRAALIADKEINAAAMRRENT
jgi:hypothetical protein